MPDTTAGVVKGVAVSILRAKEFGLPKATSLASAASLKRCADLQKRADTGK
jgi:hypothetical protein